MTEALATVSSVGVESTDKEARNAHQLPDPKGYKILISLPEPEEATEGGILKAQQTIEREEVGSIVGFVMKLGADAYQDHPRARRPQAGALAEAAGDARCAARHDLHLPAGP